MSESSEDIQWCLYSYLRQSKAAQLIKFLNFAANQSTVIVSRRQIRLQPKTWLERPLRTFRIAEHLLSIPPKMFLASFFSQLHSIPREVAGHVQDESNQASLTEYYDGSSTLNRRQLQLSLRPPSPSSVRHGIDWNAIVLRILRIDPRANWTVGEKEADLFLALLPAKFWATGDEEPLVVDIGDKENTCQRTLERSILARTLAKHLLRLIIARISLILTSCTPRNHSLVPGPQCTADHQGSFRSGRLRGACLRLHSMHLQFARFVKHRQHQVAYRFWPFHAATFWLAESSTFTTFDCEG